MQFYTVTNRCAKTAYFPNMQFYFLSIILHIIKNGFYKSAHGAICIAVGKCVLRLAPRRRGEVYQLTRILRSFRRLQKNNENLDRNEEMAIPQHFGRGVAQNWYRWYRGKTLISSPRGFSKEMARWACRTNFFLFFPTSPSSFRYPSSLVRRDSTSGWLSGTS